MGLGLANASLACGAGASEDLIADLESENALLERRIATLEAAIGAQWWNLTRSRRVMSHYVGATWVDSGANHGSGFRLSPSRNRVSASPVGTASHPA